MKNFFKKYADKIVSFGKKTLAWAIVIFLLIFAGSFILGICKIAWYGIGL